MKCIIENVVELHDGSANADVLYDDEFKMKAIEWHAANCNKFEDDTDKVVEKFVLYLLEEGMKYATRSDMDGEES